MREILGVTIYKNLSLQVYDADLDEMVYTPYYEDTLHKPNIKLASVDAEIEGGTNVIYTSGTATPRKGRMLSEIELPIEYEEFLGLTSDGTAVPRYLKLSLASGDIFGWIDGAEPVSVKGPSTNTRIRWHVDYWYTLKLMEWRAFKYPAQYVSRRLSYGRGTFKRGPVGMARPDPSVPRRWIYHSEKDLRRDLGDGKHWACILKSESSTGWDSNTLVYFPIGGSITGSGNCPNIQEIFSGRLINILGTASDKIIGAWASPIQPEFNGTVKNDNNNHYWYEITYAGTPPTIWYDVPLTTTDDIQKVIVTDQMANTIATLPWGITFNRIWCRVDIGANGAQLIMGFVQHTSDPLSDYVPVEVDGRTVTIPLVTIPMFSDAMSDYVYSGQRAYDIETAKLQREQALWNGIANVGSSALSGGVGGGLIKGGGAGAGAGAILGAGVGIGSAAFNYGLAIQYDYKGQQATDRLMANQAGSVVQYGGGGYWYDASHTSSIVIMKRDPLSKGELETEHAEIGYITDTFSTGCGTVITSGGPMRIEGLEVFGDISQEAKNYIAAMFARGVHLDYIS